MDPITFKHLTSKQLKQIIKHYNLSHHIPLSKIVDGKRKRLSKDELAEELDKHLIIDNNTIRKKEINYMYDMPKMQQKEQQEQKQPKINIIEEEKPKDENKYIVDNWKDIYLGNIIYNTKIGQNLQSFAEKKNKSNSYVDDSGLLYFFKPINDIIINRYGIDELFNGIDKIAEYYEINKYKPHFGRLEGLPVANYVNAKNNKLIHERQKQLLNEKNLIPKTKITEIDKNEFWKIANFITTVLNNNIKREISKLPQSFTIHAGYKEMNEITKQISNNVLKSKELQDKIKKKFGEQKLKDLHKSLDKYEDIKNDLKQYEKNNFQIVYENIKTVLNSLF